MGKNFFEFVQEPCRGCSAPCCKMVLINYPAPSTIMEMDYIRFMLGFPSIKMVLHQDGRWQVKVEQNCRFLDSNTNLCTVHGTSQQPGTCSYFNPCHCWYKRNYTKDNFSDLIEMDLTKYEALLGHLRFDEEGKIMEIPSWEFINALLKDVKVQIKGSASSPPKATQLEQLVENIDRWSVSK
jgi:hypothetical protein